MEVNNGNDNEMKIFSFLIHVTLNEIMILTENYIILCNSIRMRNRKEIISTSVYPMTLITSVNSIYGTCTITATAWKN